MTYFVGSTNATGTSPTATTYFFLSNPGSFAVKGTIVAAIQTVFNDTPAVLDFSTDRLSELYFVYAAKNVTHVTLAAGSSFTCTIFDGATLIGSNSSTVAGYTGSPEGDVVCAGQYPDNYYPSDYGTGFAFINFPATYNSGDTYTYIISH